MKYDDVPKLSPVGFSIPPLAAFSKCLLSNSSDLLISKQSQIDSRAWQMSLLFHPFHPQEKKPTKYRKWQTELYLNLQYIKCKYVTLVDQKC